MAELSTIEIHPIKGLEPVEPDRVAIDGTGGLEYDRRYAIFSEDDEYVNGRRNAEIHRLRSEFDLDEGAVTLWERGTDGRRRFHLDDDRGALEAWLGEFFGEPVRVVEANTNFTDNAGALSRKKITTAGPSLVSGATLREVASWFPGLTAEETRLRIRPNLVVEGVPAFWEDRLYADEDHLVEFDVGDVRLHGLRPLPRCVVPTRDPATGESSEDFVGTFTRKREETFPEWSDPDLLGAHDEVDVDHYYYLAIVTRVPPSEWGKELAVGDEVEVVGEAPLVTSL